MLPGNIDIYKSLFRGRKDIFALRWEKNGKATYFPRYDYDPYQFRLHKIKGGTIQNFSDKKLLSCSDGQITKHLNGEQFIGIYPLLKDNTSWFIVADFDKANWIEECRSFLTFCHDQGLPAYLERSRSGKGVMCGCFLKGLIRRQKAERSLSRCWRELGYSQALIKIQASTDYFPIRTPCQGRDLAT